MRRFITTLFTLIASLGLATGAVAQGRHDDRPHGYKAKSAAAQATPGMKCSRPVGGRHDEKPHGAMSCGMKPAATSAGSAPAERKASLPDSSHTVPGTAEGKGAGQ